MIGGSRMLKNTSGSKVTWVTHKRANKQTKKKISSIVWRWITAMNDDASVVIPESSKGQSLLILVSQNILIFMLLRLMGDFNHYIIGQKWHIWDRKRQLPGRPTKNWIWQWNHKTAHGDSFSTQTEANACQLIPILRLWSFSSDHLPASAFTCRPED